MLSDDEKLMVNQILMLELDLDDDEFQPDSKITENLGADSLDWTEIYLRLEEYFNTPEPDDCEHDSIITVQDLYEYIDRKKGQV